MENRRKHVAVVLLNMGGPDTLNDVRPFLFNLFRDPEIIPVPWWLRWLRIPLAWMIAFFRSPTSREGYEKIGGGSPQRRYAQAVADKILEPLRREEPDVFWTSHVCMRYFAPYAVDVVRKLQQQNTDEVLLVPLYPQYSTTTTRSSIVDFHNACDKIGFRPRTRVVRHWHLSDAYLAPAARRLKDSWEAASKEGNPFVLYSAHSIPMDRVEAGDPYPEHVNETIHALHKKAGLSGAPVLAFQSRVGPVSWLAPSVADRIPELGSVNQDRPLVLYPVSFVSDHIETLEELDMTYADLAIASGFKSVHRVPVFNDDQDFIAAFSNEIMKWYRDQSNSCWPDHCVVSESRRCLCVREN